MIRIEEYVGRDGESPFGRWFESLDAQTAAIVSTALGRLGDGNVSNVKAVGEGVPEMRIDRHVSRQ
jgi:putative component of toxin-antitoxin plasmid stabilization module